VDVAGCTGDSLVHVYTNWYRGWIYVYSCKNVPSKVCAPQVSTEERKKVRLIFHFKGIFFPTFSETSKDEGAREFLTFSHSPSLKQDELGEIIQFLRIRGRRFHLYTIV
jgi:hypothetical protein